jgi:hypothetical protein
VPENYRLYFSVGLLIAKTWLTQRTLFAFLLEDIVVSVVNSRMMEKYAQSSSCLMMKLGFISVAA